ncbi:MAG: hypothetical protein CSA42_07975 [Gammaproteobacteria bacterium]|nr:MAG: hypothetical protein CSA42_07975 [Gammaproteobacteria bacterium]
MKYFLPVVLSGIAFLGNTQDIIVVNNTAEAKKFCEEKAAKSPEELREQMLSYCLCILKHTDLKKEKELLKAGKIKELQALYKEASKACSK